MTGHAARVDHVLAMVNAALDAMRDKMDDESTSAELFSAVVTILAQFVRVLIEQGVEPEALKKAVMRAFPAPVPESKWRH